MVGKTARRPRTAIRLPPAASGLLQAQGVRRSARVGAAFEHAALLVGDDGAHGSGEPRPIRPPLDLVAELSERLPGRLGDAALEIEPAGIVGVRLERGGEAVGGDARRLDRFLRAPCRRGCTLRNTCSIACVCTSPPGVPNGIAILPGSMAIAGLGVRRGRLPGATPDGCFGSAQFWLPRDEGMIPRPGTTGAL